MCATAGSQAGARLHAVKSLPGGRNIRRSVRTTGARRWAALQTDRVVLCPGGRGGTRWSPGQLQMEPSVALAMGSTPSGGQISRPSSGVGDAVTGPAGRTRRADVGRTLGSVPSAEHELVMAGDASRARRAGGPPAPTVAEQRASYDRIADLWPVPDDVSITPVEVAGRVGGGPRRARPSDRALLSRRRLRDWQSCHAPRPGSPGVAGLGEQGSAPGLPAGARASFPAAVQDALAAFRWLLSQGHDPRRLALAGDSAAAG